MTPPISDRRPSSRAGLRAWYQSVLQQQEDAGLSIAEAAEAIGVTPVTLYAWRRRLAKEQSRARPASTPGGLIRVRIRGPEESEDTEGSIPCRHPLVLRLGGDCSAEVPAGFDKGDLARLLSVVSGC